MKRNMRRGDGDWPVVALLLGLAVIFVFGAVLADSPNDMTKPVGDGETKVINLQPGEKLVNATVDYGYPVYLTRPMKPEETPQSYELVEMTPYGKSVETKYIIHERRDAISSYGYDPVRDPKLNDTDWKPNCSHRNPEKK